MLTSDDTAPAGRCPACGRALDEHDRHVRYGLPDPVLAVPEEDREGRTWQTETLMQVEGVGAFVRVLLPVRLTGHYTVTYGLWLQVQPGDLHRAFVEWWAPTYPDLVLDGRLGNAVPPWGLLGAPARAVVRDPDHTPYVDSSPDALLDDVLTQEWPHEAVLSTLPS